MKKFLNKCKGIPESVKSSIAFAFSSFVIKGIAFIVTPIYTRLMNIEDYGVVTTYNSWVSIIEIFALLGLTSAGVFNVGLNDNKENRDRYISNCLGLCNIATIITFIIILILKLIFGNEFLLSNDLLVVMFIHFIFNPAQIFWITRQKYEYKYKMATVITICSVILGQTLSLVGILNFKENTILAKILGNEIGVLIFIIPIFILLIKKGKCFIDVKLWKTILVLALPLIPHYLAQHVMSGADKIMISNMVGTSHAAIYGVVANVGMIGAILWTAINGSLVPFTFESINNGKNEKVKSISKVLILLYSLICLSVILIAPEILRLLAPSEYFNGVYCVPPLVVVVFLQALYNLYANIEFYYKKSKRIAFATVIATVVNLVLNYIFIPKYSYVAASYTTLASYIVLVLIHYYGYKSCTKDELYDNKYMVIITAVLLGISLACNVVYSLPNIIRYVIIIIIVLILFIKKDKILMSLKEIK